MMINPASSPLRHRRLLALAAVTALVLVVGFLIAATRGPSPSTAATVTPTTADTVSVSGTGTVQGRPDTLVARFHVHVTQPSVQAALDLSAADARNVIASLERNGLTGSDIRTTDVSLDPSYNNHGAVDGYTSGESLSVRIHPLSHVGQILSAATSAAGNSVNLEGVSFDINDNSALLAAAREQAFANAKAAADQYATLGGTHLARVMHITAVVDNASPVYPGAYAAGGAAADGLAKAALPIRAGQKKVSVTVKVIWALA